MEIFSETCDNLKLVDDASNVLIRLCGEKDSSVIREKLVDIVLFIRFELKTRGSLKGSKTESLGDLESSVIAFLDKYNGSDFEELYSIIYELIRLIPKFNIYGIDITELRDIAHDFDAELRYNEVFGSIASDIRRLTHQHLSEKLIVKIEKLDEFLKSTKPSAMIEGSTVINATREDKDDLLESDVFKELINLKDRLKIAWSDRGDKRDHLSREAFFRVIEANLEGLITDEIRSLSSFKKAISYINDAKESLSEQDWIDVSLGRVRYYLKKFIEEITISEIENKGEVLFHLITIDSLLEQISFIYYSNIVNSRLKEIDDSNYIDSLHILVELALCTRSVGYGTKILGRFAFLIEDLIEQLDVRPDRVAHLPSIVEAMNSELENNFLSLKELYSRCLLNKNNAPALTSILNDIIREKTTHLLGNLINSVKNYDEKKTLEPYLRLLEKIEKKKNLTIEDLIYPFGTDIFEQSGAFEGPEFMGGKGFSQIRNSRIIQSTQLPDFDVPKGFGFSTLTYHYLKNNTFSKDDLKREMITIVSRLEQRTGRTFGNGANPLLLMARSGAVVSMPGMLETVSHIGINKTIAEEWSRTLEEPARAYQAYINFMLSYAKSVLGIDTTEMIKETGFDSYVSVFREGLFIMRDVAEVLDELISEHENGGIPDDPFEQLFASVIAVFQSFNKEIVQKQIKQTGIPHQFQTGCLIQECVPVLSSGDCSGVFFTRNPNTGKIGSMHDEQIEFSDGFFGDVIADGTITPGNTMDFIRIYPEKFEAFLKFKHFDERIQRFPTDIEFAIRNNITYIVQSRILKQSPIARIINSYEFYKENMYTKYKLIKRTAFGLNKKIIAKYLDRKALSDAPLIAQGKPVNGGAVRGRIIKNQNNIDKFDGPLIFITESNVPPRVIMDEDRFLGYLSTEGGVTSHAALVAIGEGKPCVTDVPWSHGENDDEIILGTTLLKEGDYITLDANTGQIYIKDIPILEVSIGDSEYREIRDDILSVIEELVSPVEESM